MKRTLALSLICFSTLSSFALPDYDPFADASGSGGSSFAIGSNLAGQINAQGLSWFGAGPTTGTPLTPTIVSGNIPISGLSAGEGNRVKMVPGAGPSARLGIGTSFMAESSSLYYSFAFNVDTVGNLSTSGAFFAGFNNVAATSTTTPSVVGARLYLRKVSATTFNIGISKASGSSSDWSWDPGVYNAGQNFFVVGAYNYGQIGTTLNDDSASLWINPNSLTFGDPSAPSPSLTATSGTDFSNSGTTQPLTTFVLMQRATGNQPDVLFVDELRVGTSWADVTTVPEPSALALGGLGMLALIAVNRSRRS